jgi:hypothetical protein
LQSLTGVHNTRDKSTLSQKQSILDRHIFLNSKWNPLDSIVLTDFSSLGDGKQADDCGWNMREEQNYSKTTPKFVAVVTSPAANLSPAKNLSTVNSYNGD